MNLESSCIGGKIEPLDPSNLLALSTYCTYFAAFSALLSPFGLFMGFLQMTIAACGVANFIHGLYGVTSMSTAGIIRALQNLRSLGDEETAES